jgi:hypothetical protein
MKINSKNIKAMSIRLWCISGLGLLLLSCDKSNNPTSPPRFLPDVNGQNIITSLINNKKKTIAICYGNNLAIQASNDDTHVYQPGQSYILITWSQKPMPHWYGTNMNGEILSFESVDIFLNNAGKLSYRYKSKLSPKARIELNQQKTEERIKFIIGQRGAAFPE